MLLSNWVNYALSESGIRSWDLGSEVDSTRIFSFFLVIEKTTLVIDKRWSMRNITTFLLRVSALLAWSTGNYIITHSDIAWADLMALRINWANKWAVLHDLLIKSYIKTDKCLISHGAVDCLSAQKTRKQLKVYHR